MLIRIIYLSLVLSNVFSGFNDKIIFFNRIKIRPYNIGRTDSSFLNHFRDYPHRF